MRVALLVLNLTIASLAGSMDARAEFNRFQTPGEGIRCLRTDVDRTAPAPNSHVATLKSLKWEFAQQNNHAMVFSPLYGLLFESERVRRIGATPTASV